MSEWREADHPRDEGGRFTESWAAAASDRMGSQRYWPQYRSGRDLFASGWAEQNTPRLSELLRRWEEDAWPYGDPVVGAVAQEQGFDGLPSTGTSDELDEAVRAGGIEIWRGYGLIHDPSDHLDRTGGFSQLMRDMSTGLARGRMLAVQREWRDGEYKAGNGVYGQGTYTSGDERAARTFGVYGRRYGFGDDEQGDPASVQRMVLSPDARIYDYGTDPRVGPWADRSRRSEPLRDPGRMLAAMGYDAMRIPAGEDDGSGLDEVQYVIFNRTALIVEEPDGTP